MKKLIFQLTALALAVILSGAIACQKKASGGDGGSGDSGQKPGMCG